MPGSTAPGAYMIGVRCGGRNVGVGATLQVTSQGTTVPATAPSTGRSGERNGWIVAGVIAALVVVPAVETVALTLRFDDLVAVGHLYLCISQGEVSLPA